MATIKLSHKSGPLDINIISVNSRCVDIVVNDDMTIDMRVPVGMDREMVERYVRINEEAIRDEYDRKLARNHQSLPAVLELTEGKIVYRSGMRLPFFGHMDLRLRIKYTTEGEETRLYDEILPDGNRVLTICADHEDQHFLRYCVMRYYRRQAEEFVKKRVQDFGEKMSLSWNRVQITGQTRASQTGRARLAYRNIALKNQKTLWGSCNWKHNLKFDWKIAMLPAEVIEYIIVHEMTHLKRFNHSRRFWKEIEAVMPEYRECRCWLDKHGKEYEIF